MEVDRTHYVAGDTVEGCVYVNAKATKSYKNLVLRLRGIHCDIVGDEHVEWYEHYGNNTTAMYENDFQNYDSVFTLADFNGQLNQGQYSFPFAFIIPHGLSGSFHESDENFIRYSLMAVINHPTEVKNAQIFTLFLNVQEPIRQKFGIMSKNQGCHSRCCGCCIDYGLITISMVSDKNFAINGDNIVVSGFIDHTKGKNNIESAKIILEERRTVVSDCNVVRDWDDHEYYLGEIGPVNSGEKKNYNVPVKIPETLAHYTAIGSVTGRYFLLIVRAEMGCCASPPPEASLHLVLQSKTPEVEKPKKVDPPAGWSPVQAQKVVCSTMKQFTYSPDFAIVHRNEYPHNNQGEGVKPYFADGTMEQMK